MTHDKPNPRLPHRFTEVVDDLKFVGSLVGDASQTLRTLDEHPDAPLQAMIRKHDLDIDISELRTWLDRFCRYYGKALEQAVEVPEYKDDLEYATSQLTKRVLESINDESNASS